MQKTRYRKWWYIKKTEALTPPKKTRQVSEDRNCTDVWAVAWCVIIQPIRVGQNVSTKDPITAFSKQKASQYHLSTTHNPGSTQHFTTRLMTNLLIGKTYYVRGFCFHRKLGGFIVLPERLFFLPFCVTLHRTWPPEVASAEKKNTGKENGAQNRQSMDL